MVEELECEIWEFEIIFVLFNVMVVLGLGDKVFEECGEVFWIMLFNEVMK